MRLNFTGTTNLPLISLNFSFKTTVEICLEAILINNKTFIESQLLRVFLPGNLSPPTVWLQKLELNAITVAWGIPQTFGIELEGFYVDFFKLSELIKPLIPLQI